MNAPLRLSHLDWQNSVRNYQMKPDKSEVKIEYQANSEILAHFEQNDKLAFWALESLVNILKRPEN